MSFKKYLVSLKDDLSLSVSGTSRVRVFRAPYVPHICLYYSECNINVPGRATFETQTHHGHGTYKIFVMF